MKWSRYSGFLVAFLVGACTDRAPTSMVRAQVEIGDVEQLTVVNFPQGKQSFTKVVLLSDGTAIKRDLSSKQVFNGTLPPERFSAIARHVALIQPHPEGNGSWEAALISPEGDHTVNASKSTFNQRLLQEINQELSAIDWNQL